MFAAYNQWANNILYQAVAELSSEQYHRDCGAFFASVHGTLHHILVGDLVWMSRFEGTDDAPKSFDVFLHESLDTLHAARLKMDERIVSFARGLSENDLASEFTYRTIVDPATLTQRLAPALAHFFNHQTHHRGQVHTLLSQLTGDAPPLDLIYYLRDVS